MGAVAYKLRLPKDTKIHPVFHISLLKPCAEPPADVALDLPPTAFGNHPLIFPAVVLNSRTIRRGDNLILQILVQWHGLALEDASWEGLNWVKHCYPTFDLEDNVCLEGESNDVSSSKSGKLTDGVVGERLINEGGLKKDSGLKAIVQGRTKKRPKRFDDYL